MDARRGPRRSGGCDRISRLIAARARSPTGTRRASTPASGATRRPRWRSGRRSTQPGPTSFSTETPTTTSASLPRTRWQSRRAKGDPKFVVGTGGAFFTPWSSVKPNSEIRQNGTFGVLTLALHGGSFDWRFAPEAGARFTDAGAGLCHGRTPGFAPRCPGRSRCRARVARSAGPTATTGWSGHRRGTSSAALEATT